MSDVTEECNECHLEALRAPSTTSKEFINTKGFNTQQGGGPLWREEDKVGSEELLQVFLSRQPGFRLTLPRMLAWGQDMVAGNSNADDPGPIES